MATPDTFMPVSTPHHDPSMAVSDYNYNVMAQQAAFPTGLPTPASGQYCPIDFTANYLTPEPTLSEFAVPTTHETPQLGLNISAVQPFHPPARPHSSPSTFGPNDQDLLWGGMPHQPQLNRGGLLDAPPSAFWHSTFPPVRIPTPRHRYSNSSTSATDIKTPQPRRPYPVLVPNAVPSNLNPLKRSSPDGLEENTSSPELSKIKRRRTSPMPVSMLPASPELSDEDQLLLRLKEEEHVPWKDIAARFQSELGKVYQVPALQMRLKRLRERLRVWTDTDMTALRLAHEHWERNKFEIIASKMVEFGANEKWTGRQCSKKWLEINQGADVYGNQSVPTPAFSYTSSPIEQSTPTFAPPPFMGIVPHA